MNQIYNFLLLRRRGKLGPVGLARWCVAARTMRDSACESIFLALVDGLIRLLQMDQCTLWILFTPEMRPVHFSGQIT